LSDFGLSKGGPSKERLDALKERVSSLFTIDTLSILTINKQI